LFVIHFTAKLEGLGHPHKIAGVFDGSGNLVGYHIGLDWRRNESDDYHLRSNGPKEGLAEFVESVAGERHPVGFAGVSALREFGGRKVRGIPPRGSALPPGSHYTLSAYGHPWWPFLLRGRKVISLTKKS
jgi:hypothetical protein